MTTSRAIFCTLVFFTGAASTFFVPQAHATELKGVVQDPTGNGIPGAQVAAINPVGVITEQVTDDRGIFDLYISPLYENVQLRVAAEGFATSTVSAATAVIHLALAPQSESVAVTASAIDAVPASQP